ncbi:MAG: HD domain-containing protein [Chitinophagaceae bacterium]|nr:HD domain-containing protein [Oligoflexus sp.]
MSRKFIIKESTRNRCKIIPIEAHTLAGYRPISLELFAYLWDVKTIDFSIYLRVEKELLEYIKPSELSVELLQHIWLASLREDAGVDVYVARKDFPKFEHTLDYVRRKKINALLEREQGLDRRTLEVFADLSGASQMVLRGGIDKQVAERVKAAASAMVQNLMDSDCAMATLSRMISIDPTLYDHSASVAMFATVMARRQYGDNMPFKDAVVLAQSGLYHDAGKSCVPNAILNKPGAFTPEEFDVMKSHVHHGFRELSTAIHAGAPIDPLVAQVAIEHHERFTGKGYPYGKKGRFEEDAEFGIHPYARIVSIADAYSALLMKRVYKPALPAEKALELMEMSAGNDFDPLIFAPFAANVKLSLNLLRETREKEQKKSGNIYMVEKGDSIAKKINETRKADSAKAAVAKPKIGA